MVSVGWWQNLQSEVSRNCIFLAYSPALSTLLHRYLVNRHWNGIGVSILLLMFATFASSRLYYEELKIRFSKETEHRTVMKSTVYCSQQITAVSLKNVNVFLGN